MTRLRSIFLLASLVAAAPSLAATPVLRDDFSDSRSGWPNMAATRAGDLGLAIYTDSGKYQLTPVQDEVFGFITAPRQASGGDVAVETDLFLYAGLGGGAAGVGCRYKDHRNFYAFTVRGDATLTILKIKDGRILPLAQGKVASIMPGTVDTRLSVECRGDSLRFSAKGGGTLSANDGDFSDGPAGVFVVGQKTAGVSGVFDNFVLADPAGR
ncbi:MAG: hypothetical protein WCZ65_09290 [Lysobacteraceae bacterium]